MTAKSYSEVLSESAQKFGSRPFLSELAGGLELTFADVDRAASQFASWTAKQGLKPGDTLSFCLENSAAVPIVYFGGLRAGLTVNPLPSALSDAELAKNVGAADPAWVLLQRDGAKILEGKNVGWTALTGGTKEFLDLIRDQPTQVKERSGENPIGVKYYTSGTTLSPKCILQTHEGLLWATDAVIESFKFSENESHLGVLPMGHTAILAYSLLPMLRVGGRVWVAENFFKIRAQFWKLVVEKKITYCEIVPTILFMLLNTPYDRKDVEANETLKYLACGSAPLSLETQQACRQQFGISVANLYGTSETGPTHFDDPREPDWVSGTIGKPMRGIECIVLRDDGSRCPVGTVGEIAVRAPSVTPGYYKNDTATRESFRDGFFLTGDLGYIDADGRWFFSGRKKDLIIKGGVNILPAEIEEILYQHAGVQVAAVVGVPNKIMGEDIVAFVQPKSNQVVDPPQVRSYVAKQVQQFKVPSRVIVLDSIPVGPSGKVLKRELRRRFMEGEWSEPSQHES